MSYSVNVCLHCRKQLTISADQLGYRECANCNYFHTLGIYTVEQYNEWLKKK